MSFFSALTTKPNSITLLQMYKIIEEMYTVSLAYGLRDPVLFLFNGMLLIHRKLKFKQENLQDWYQYCGIHFKSLARKSNSKPDFAYFPSIGLSVAIERNFHLKT